MSTATIGMSTATMSSSPLADAQATRPAIVDATHTSAWDEGPSATPTQPVRQASIPRTLDIR
jgi:hypothetical protein